MHTPITDRVLAALGLFYPVLLVMGAVAFPAPAAGDSATHDPSFLAAHTGAVIGQSYVRALAAVAFIALVVAVTRVVTPRSRPSGLPRLVLAGGLGYALMLVIAQALTLSAALASRDGASRGAIGVFDSLDAGVLSMSSLPAVLMFAAAGAGFLAQRRVPRWLTMLTLAGVPLSLLDAVSYDGGPLAAVGIVGLIYFLVWGLSTSAHLVRSPMLDRESPAVA